MKRKRLILIGITFLLILFVATLIYIRYLRVIGQADYEVSTEGDRAQRIIVYKLPQERVLIVIRGKKEAYFLDLEEKKIGRTWVMIYIPFYIFKFAFVNRWITEIPPFYYDADITVDDKKDRIEIFIKGDTPEAVEAQKADSFRSSIYQKHVVLTKK